MIPLDMIPAGQAQRFEAHIRGREAFQKVPFAVYVSLDTGRPFLQFADDIDVTTDMLTDIDAAVADYVPILSDALFTSEERAAAQFVASVDAPTDAQLAELVLRLTKAVRRINATRITA